MLAPQSADGTEPLSDQESLDNSRRTAKMLPEQLLHLANYLSSDSRVFVRLLA
jgi:hypothetical protein